MGGRVMFRLSNAALMLAGGLFALSFMEKDPWKFWAGFFVLFFIWIDPD